MEYIDLQGAKIPALGLGTWQIKGDECREAVENALDIGYRHIDTAQAYGNEEYVGEGIQRSDVSRENVWLTTKLWKDNLNSENLKDSVDESLEKLNTNYLDLLLIHWPFNEMDLETVLKQMNQLVDEGKTLNIGISNFNSKQIKEASKISELPLLTNQVEYHPFLNQDKILEKCREKGMMLTAYSPLARGQVIGNQTLKQIGEKHGKSEAQIALRWLIQQKNVAAIPKASKKKHQQQNFEIFNFKLNQEELEEIKKLTRKNDRKINPEFAPKWD